MGCVISGIQHNCGITCTVLCSTKHKWMVKRLELEFIWKEKDSQDSLPSLWNHFTLCVMVKDGCQHRKSKQRLNKLLSLQYITLCNQNLYCMLALGNLRYKMKASDSVSWSWTCLDAHTNPCLLPVVSWNMNTSSQLMMSHPSRWPAGWPGQMLGVERLSSEPRKTWPWQYGSCALSVWNAFKAWMQNTHKYMHVHPLTALTFPKI